VNDIERLRQSLERARSEGVRFDDAWKLAMRGVRDGHARAALNHTAWSWFFAYSGDVPAARRERAAAQLVECLAEPE
jgi:hypothetical protein